MIRTVGCNSGIFHLEYPEVIEQEILLNYLIKEYNLGELEYKATYDGCNGCNIINRVINTKGKYPVVKIIDCIRAIEKYKSYKRIEIKRFLRTESEYVELTREEKLIEMKSILIEIENIMNIDITEDLNDIEFLKKELGI